ncbi:MAG: ATP-binding cassette domain-containing protein [Ruminococcus bromii]|nr:ATP-binding cassette domain-containing protein [Ruminococcus bromii]MCI7212244.1 ATP-binding cassette domain-containing protein [Ruminococcus bromii]MDD6434671.1 ATP-binding cassette domain-containing protein [Ruminococcus bromii]MDY4084290.1 ATP-binding cassette domain-containing protein [Ruminococcus bromii]MDY4711131.1 ATP-binding cassette domain-containing protein [Ruminococcus bromii]
MSNYVLKTTNLCKRFKSYKALDNVSVTLEKGKIYGLIGKNGAGKTTLMRIVSGLSYATEGTIELFGASSAKEYNKQLSKIGTLIEYPSLNGRMTAKQNIKLVKIMRGIKDKSVDDELLEMVGLGSVDPKKKVKDFSLGMRQRLGIAIAMLTNPELLILDEPVNGLDPVGVVEIRNLIKKLNQEKNITVLISSHNLPELYQTATDYIIIDKGVIKQTLTLDELEKKCEHYLSITCDDPDKAIKVIENELGTKKYKRMQDGSIRLYDFVDEKQKVSDALFNNHIKVYEFSRLGETLENYFLSVIGESGNV